MILFNTRKVLDMKKIFSNFILRLIILSIILSLFNPIYKNELVRFILIIFTLTFITSTYEFYKYKELLEKQSNNTVPISNTSFNILKDDMNFLNNYTLVNNSNNQLIFLSSPNIILNSHFLIIKIKPLSDTKNKIQIRSYPSLKNPFSKPYSY